MIGNLYQVYAPNAARPVWKYKTAGAYAREVRARRAAFAAWRRGQNRTTRVLHCSPLFPVSDELA